MFQNRLFTTLRENCKDSNKPDSNIKILRKKSREYSQCGLQLTKSQDKVMGRSSKNNLHTAAKGFSFEATTSKEVASSQKEFSSRGREKFTPGQKLEQSSSDERPHYTSGHIIHVHVN
jgi:hypothetical protein